MTVARAEDNSFDIIHVPVFWREVLTLVAESDAAGTGIFVDCTLGEGGHSEQILLKFPNAKVIAFERDPEILEVAKQRLDFFGDRIVFVNDNFASLPKYLKDHGLLVQYILFDYGISSYHFEMSGRGFSFRQDEPLDMRLSGSGKSAADIVNKASVKELSEIFYKFGEERWANRIAAYIARQRDLNAFKTTGELADVVMRAIPSRFHVRNIHPATRVFQALRIAVNGELDAISAGLDSLWKHVATGGLVMAISFHSLEDRIVKNMFRQWERGCVCGLEPDKCVCANKPFVSVLTKKPILPTDEELAENSRARSAKLRVCRRKS